MYKFQSKGTMASLGIQVLQRSGRFPNIEQENGHEQ
jgi:hypothetical protein